jgi:hypothetical protein
MMRAFASLFGAGLFFAAALSAADITGIWMGQTQGRNGEKQDLAFQFQSAKGAVTGVMFGDEFDLPVQELHVDGDHISFTVMSVNYYDARRITTVFSGTMTGTTLELTRQQIGPGTGANPAKPRESKQVITLKKLA